MTSIFSCPGFDEQQFYAALYYLSVIQQQQKIDERHRLLSQKFPESSNLTLQKALSPLLQDNIMFINSFLDRLALLFARFRTKKTPENVTAAAIYEDETSPMHWTIVFAKNNGHDTTDTECSKKLVEWWMCPEGESPLDRDPGPGNKAWEYLETFWSDRIKHYIKNILKLFPRVKLDRDDPWIQQAMEIAKAIVAEDNITEAANADSSAGSPTLQKKSKGVQSVTDDRKLPFELFERCYSFRLQRNTRNKAQTLSLQLGKIIHYIEMLGMLKSIWNSLAGFRRLASQQDEMHLQTGFLEHPASSKLKKSSLYSTITKWNGDQTFEDEKETMVLKSLMAGQKNDANNPNYVPQGAFDLYFHCELQILEHLSTINRAHTYIGVSKLSCYLCGLILEQQSCRFKSRGSHGQISANCMFPNRLSETRSILEVFLDALLVSQGQMLLKINRAALGLNASWERHELRIQTNPGPSVLYSGHLGNDVAHSTGESPVVRSRSRVTRDPRVSQSIEVLHGSLVEGQDVQLKAMTVKINLSLSNSWFVRGQKFFLSFVDWVNRIWLPEFVGANDTSAGTWGAVCYDIKDQPPKYKVTNPLAVCLWFQFTNIKSLEVGDEIYLTVVDPNKPFDGMPWCDIGILQSYDFKPLLRQWSDAGSRRTLIRDTYEMENEKASMVWARKNSRAGILILEEREDHSDDETYLA